MKGLLVSFLATLLFSSTSIAESKALEERGASCTEHCTSEGKFIITEDTLLKLKGSELSQFSFRGEGADENTLKAYKRLYDRVDRTNEACSNFSLYAKRPGNLEWCKTKCMATGGMKSWLAGRAAKVRDFVQQRERTCWSIRIDLLKNNCFSDNDGYIKIPTWEAGEKYLMNSPL